jgi:hypothetical protein
MRMDERRPTVVFEDAFSFLVGSSDPSLFADNTE